MIRMDVSQLVGRFLAHTRLWVPFGFVIFCSSFVPLLATLQFIA